MKKILILFLFISAFVQAQYSITGKMIPPQKQNWIILYKIEGARQVFVKSATIKTQKEVINGKETSVGAFTFNLPKDAKAGSYRATYKLEGAGFVDFLFNKENIDFTFNPNNPELSIEFSKSEENILYQNYLKAIGVAQHKTDSLQVAYLKGSHLTTPELYKKSIQNINAIQTAFGKKSNGKLAHDFIKATNRYNAPEIAKNSKEYINGVINHFFDNIDFNNKSLYNSSFLTDRVTDYVFYLNYSENPITQENLHKRAVKTVLNLTNDVNFKKDLMEFLIAQFSTAKSVALVDDIFTNYYKKLPENLQDKEFVAKTKEALAAEVGRIAPNFSWEENGKTMSLDKLNNAQQYILVFWSTECSHCLREIPELYKLTKDKKGLKVIAFGMETSPENWKKYTKDLKGWHNVLGLGKWENKTARTYQIYSTPSYFILDKEKRIVAKPNELVDVKKVLQLN